MKFHLGLPFIELRRAVVFDVVVVESLVESLVELLGEVKLVGKNGILDSCTFSHRLFNL